MRDKIKTAITNFIPNLIGWATILAMILAPIGAVIWLSLWILKMLGVIG